MTKIALTTKYSAYNFGAVLQTYALSRTLEKLGAQCVVVDADRQRKKGLMPWNAPGNIVNNLFYLKHKNELQTGYRRFDAFIETMPLSESYKSYDALRDRPVEADVYLSGSDQVWNPLDVRENYFLRYAPADKIRASYAASMGISYLPAAVERITREYLREMDYLSVREKTAKDMIGKLTGREAAVHADPVFLLSPEEWDEVAIKPDFHKPYIFCYVLYRPSWLNKWLKKLHKKTGKEIVVVSSDAYRNIYHTKMVRSAGPREMLGWLQNADFVISSSFHGAALSVANRKPFYAVVNPNSPARITDMLDTFGLGERIIDETHPLRLDDLDYKNVAPLQEKEQNRSYEYLRFLIEKPGKVPAKDFTQEKLSGTVVQVGDRCTGCTACSYVCPTKAISMQEDEEGFCYPAIDESKCISCGKCLRVCHAAERWV